VRLADVGPDGGDLLDPAERRRAARLKNPADRSDFLAGRIALRIFAAGILGVGPDELASAYSCPDCGTDQDHGRPGYRLAGTPAGLALSFSRCRGWALLAARPDAAGPAAIGVDLEHSAGVRFAGFDAVALTPAERQRVGALAPDRRDPWRAQAWARKEALLKARGTGLRIDPAAVEAFARDAGSGVLQDLDTVALGLPGGFAAALALAPGR
jgi:4'-phosphopantetheinyl transferase